MFRVIRGDVPFKINLNINDYVPTALVVGNEIFGGWCEDNKITGEECNISILVRGLLDVSLYFLKAIYRTGEVTDDYLISFTPEPSKDDLEFWHKMMREFNVELSEDVLAYYVSSLGFYYARPIFLLRKPESGDDYEVVMIFKSYGTEDCPKWIRKRKEGEIVKVTVKLKDFVTDVIQLAEEYLEILEEREKYLNRKILVNTKLSEELSPEEEIEYVEELKDGINFALFVLRELFRRIYIWKEESANK